MVRQSIALAILWQLVLFTPTAEAQELLGLEEGLPCVEFDVPRAVVAHDISPRGLADIWPDHRLVEVVIPISVRVTVGNVSRVREVAIDVTGPAETQVHDFAPRTTLDTRGLAPVAVTTTNERGRSVDATLGGQLPIPGLEAAAKVTPSISANRTSRGVTTETTTRLPAQQPVIVSGTRESGRGVFFQMRPSPQATLEGQHELRLQLLVRECDESAEFTVDLAAKGHRKVLWIDQPQTWGSQHATIAVRYVVGATPVSHQVAKAVAVER